jgi:hypothetical protein
MYIMTQTSHTLMNKHTLSAGRCSLFIDDVLLQCHTVNSSARTPGCKADERDATCEIFGQGPSANKGAPVVSEGRHEGDGATQHRWRASHSVVTKCRRLLP